MQRERRLNRLGMLKVAVLLMAGAGLTGCAGSLEPRQPDGPGVTGRMILVDDTGLPPTPDSGGGILVIPDAASSGLWQRVGEKAPDREGALAYIGFQVSSELVADLDGELVPVDDDGHFRLTRAAGRHLICRTSDLNGSGAWAGGCDLIRLPESGALKATFGEGGFHAALVRQ
jgi:hypothetical protein